LDGIALELLEFFESAIALSERVLYLHHSVEGDVLDGGSYIRPGDRHAGNARLVRQYRPDNLIDKQLLGWVLYEQRIAVTVMDVVAYPKELLLAVAHGYHYGGDI